MKAVVEQVEVLDPYLATGLEGRKSAQQLMVLPQSETEALLREPSCRWVKVLQDRDVVGVQVEVRDRTFACLLRQ